MCRGGQGASAHTIFRLRGERLPTLLHRSTLGERMLPNTVASVGMFTPCQRASWAAEPILLRSFS